MDMPENPYEDFNTLDELRDAGYAPESFPLLAGIYRWSVGLAVVAGVVGFCGMWYLLRLLISHDLYGRWWEMPVLMAPMLPFMAFCVRAAVFFMIFLYRSWEIVQDGHARTTPQRMIWRLIIPVYNFYWIFVAVFGLGREMQAYCRRHGLETVRTRTGIRFAFVSCVTMIIPGLNLLTPLLLIPAMNGYGRMAERIQEFRLEDRWRQ